MELNRLIDCLQVHDEVLEFETFLLKDLANRENFEMLSVVRGILFVQGASMSLK